MVETKDNELYEIEVMVRLRQGKTKAAGSEKSEMVPGKYKTELVLGELYTLQKGFYVYLNVDENCSYNGTKPGHWKHHILFSMMCYINVTMNKTRKEKCFTLTISIFSATYF